MVIETIVIEVTDERLRRDTARGEVSRRIWVGNPKEQLIENCIENYLALY
jgi:hypothetical protein